MMAPLASGSGLGSSGSDDAPFPISRRSGAMDRLFLPEENPRAADPLLQLSKNAVRAEPLSRMSLKHLLSSLSLMSGAPRLASLGTSVSSSPSGSLDRELST